MSRRLTHGRKEFARRLDRANRRAPSAARTDEAELRAQLRARLAQQAAVAGLGQFALSGPPLQALMNEAVALVALTLNVDMAEVLELVEGEGQFLVRSGVGLAPSAVGSARVSAGAESQAGFTLLRGEPVLVEDLATEQRFRVPATLVDAGAVSGISVPIGGPERRFGVLGAHVRHRRQFTDEDVRFLESIATVLAVAVERHRADEAVRSSEESFRALIEKAPDVVLVQRGGRLVYVNPSFLKLFGYERPDEVIGRLVLELTHPDDRAEMAQRVGGARSPDGYAPPRELRLLSRDGTPLVCEWVGIQVNFEGRPACVAIGRDLSERKQMQARLVLSGRMASVGTLAAGVAHELNNPLAYVLSNLEFLAGALGRHRAWHAGYADGAEGDRAERALAEMVQAVAEAREGAERMRLIVRDLKTYTRGDETKREPVDVRKVLDSAVNLAWNEIRHRSRLAKDLREVPPVDANEARLCQVFVNLLINAAHAIREGAPSQNEIVLATHLAPDGRVAVEIRDTGCGISQQNIDRIFDPFFTTKPVGIGTGLGLWICHNIVAAHGGEIEVRSRIGEGTAFRVLLPARVDRGAPREGPVLTPPPGSCRGRVLVVDDEPLVGNTIRRWLAHEHDVAVVTSAGEALRLIRGGERFDAIVCDLLMPEMTGMDLHAELGRTASELASRMLFVTGGAFTPAARSFLEKQVPCLEKPFDVERLRSEVRKLVDPA